MFKNLNPTAIGIAGHQSELLESALSNGFQGIDLNISEFATRVRLKGIDFAKRLLTSAKIRIGSFPLPFELDADDAAFQQELGKLPEIAQYAAAVGCVRTTTVLKPANNDRPYHENFEFHRRRLQEVCGVLAPTGVRLVVGFQAAECHRRDKAFQFIHDLDALSLLANMVGAQNLGLMVDAWEIVASGNTIDAVRKLPAGQIAAVQIADMPADVPLEQLDDDARLLPATENARVDCVALLSMLHEMKYDGPVTVASSRSLFQGRRREIVVKQIAEAFDKVWRAAGLQSATRPSSVARG